MIRARLRYLCCMCLKPRHKKLIAKIFPANSDDGLVKSKMDKLLLYALSRPDKVHDIAENFSQRISRDMYRHYRIGFIFLNMDAMYELLLACRIHGLYLYATSYLNIIMKLLVNNCIDLQVMATDYFIKFTYLEEDGQTYYDWYDVFVLRFKDMCYCKGATGLTKYRIRMTGLRGIQGILRKAVTDEQEVKIWQSETIKKIVSSLLYNMNDLSSQPQEHSYLEEAKSLSPTAEQIFRDLMNNATFGTIKSILKPVLIHLDYHQLWVPNDFAVIAFKTIMNSIQTKYSYIVLQMLVSHMDTYIEGEPIVKTKVINVIYQNVLIASDSCIFPTMLEVFDSLLKHLKVSLQSDHQDWQFKELEETFQSTIINTLNEISNRLSSYQKIDTMMFLLGKFPQNSTNETYEDLQISSQLQKMLLKILHTISTELRFVVGMNAFSPEFLVLLLKIAQNKEARFRIRVEQILHDLLDKHHNRKVLSKVCLLEDLSDVTLEITARQDIMFMKRNGYLFYQHIYGNIEMESNDIENFELIYSTMSLIAVEFGCKEIIVDLHRLALDIQDMVSLHNNLSTKHIFAIHSLIAAYLNLLTKLIFIAGISDHINEVIERRKQEAECLLPDFNFNNKGSVNSYPVDFLMDEKWLFSRKVIYERFQSASSINIEINTSAILKRSWSIYASKSAMDLISTGQLMDSELEMAQGTSYIMETNDKLTFKDMKEVLTCQPLNIQYAEEKRLQIYRKFKYGEFEDIMKTSKDKIDNFHTELKKALDIVSDEPENPLDVLKDKDIDHTYFFEDINIPFMIY